MASSGIREKDKRKGYTRKEYKINGNQGLGFQSQVYEKIFHHMFIIFVILTEQTTLCLVEKKDN